MGRIIPYIVENKKCLKPPTYMYIYIYIELVNGGYTQTNAAESVLPGCKNDGLIHKLVCEVQNFGRTW